MPSKPTQYQFLIESAADIGTKDGPCLIWPHCRVGNGYGYLRAQGKARLAHRVVYEHFVGPIPDGLDCCHHCDARLCYRVSHLFIGTRKENMRDCIAKGRFTEVGWHGRKGEEHHNTRLTNEQVLEIVEHLKDGWWQWQVADMYGVNRSCIGNIARGYTWGHLTGISC